MEIFKIFEMNKSNINSFELSYDNIHAMKKQDLVDQIKKMNGKIVVGSHAKDLCHQIEKLTKRLNDVVATNEEITSELLIVKNVTFNPEKRITTLVKLLAKAEQDSRSNNVETSGISNDVLDNDLEENVVEICKGSDIFIAFSDIEGCHRLPLGKNSASENKQVIARFVNRKHSELMLRLKKNISRISVPKVK